MQTEITSLDKLSVGEKMKISEIGRCAAAERLAVFGFIKDEVIETLYIGFGGSPIAVYVCGAVVAVRAKDAEKIIGERQACAKKIIQIKKSRGGECYF